MNSKLDHDQLLGSLGLQVPLEETNSVKAPKNANFSLKGQEKEFDTKFQTQSKILCTLSLEITDEITEKIDIQEDDNPYDLALELCKKYSFSDEFADFIAEKIIEKVKSVFDDSNVFQEDEHRETEESGWIPKGTFKFESGEKEQSDILKNTLEDLKLINEKNNSKSDSAILISENDSKDDSHSRLDKKIAKLKKIQEEKNSQYTFRPRINQRSANLISPQRNDSRIEDILLTKGEIAKKHAEKLKKELDNKEIKECTFKPSINKSTFSEKKSDSNVFEKLYSHHKAKKESIIQKRIHQERIEYEFTPKLNKTPTRFRVEESFEERTKRDLENRNRKKEENSKNSFSFTPKTNKTHVNRNLDNLSIGEYLYNKAFEKKSEISIDTVSSNRFKENINSSQIFERLIDRKSEEIFGILNSKNNHEYLSANSMYIEGLPTQLLILLKPLLLEIDHLNLAINLTEFKHALENFMKSLTPENKQIILRFDSLNVSKPSNSELIFKPNIDQNSILIAKNRYYGNMKVEDRLLAEKKIYDVKRESRHLQSIYDEMKLCPFEPDIS